MDARQAREHGYLAAGEVAGLLGITPRTVHFYEEAGLVTPRRSSRGTRFYSDGDLRRLEVCVQLACLGVPLRTISRVAKARAEADTGAEYSRALVEVLAEIRGEFRIAVAAARQMLEAIDTVEDALDDVPAGSTSSTERITADHSRAARAMLELIRESPQEARTAPDSGGDPPRDADCAPLRRTS